MAIRFVSVTIRKIMGPILGACVLGYFLFHAIHGERGLFSLIELEKRVARTEAVAAKLKEQKNIWKHRVALLHPSRIDPDMLEERVRDMLNFGHKDDVVFIIGQDKWSG